MKSQVQRLASFAYEKVIEVKGEEYEKKYSSHVRKLPSMITYNGLLTTVAFIRSKAGSDEGWEKVEKDIKEYLKVFEYKEVNSLVKFFADLELQEYRLYTKKLLYFANWLKRIAEGELKHEEQE